MGVHALSSARSVNISSVFNPEHEYRSRLIVHLIDDSVWSTSSRPEASKFSLEWMTDAMRS